MLIGSVLQVQSVPVVSTLIRFIWCVPAELLRVVALYSLQSSESSEFIIAERQNRQTGWDKVKSPLK